MREREQFNKQMDVLRHFRIRGKYAFLEILKKTIEQHGESLEDAVKIVEDLLINIRSHAQH